MVSLELRVPDPATWCRLHEVLADAWRRSRESSTPKPPAVPQILQSCQHAPFLDHATFGGVRREWKALLSWANQFGFEHLVVGHLCSYRNEICNEYGHEYEPP